MILDEILAHKRREVAERRSQRPLDVLEAAISLSRSDMRAAVQQTGGALREGETPSPETRNARPQSGSPLREGERLTREIAEGRLRSGSDLRNLEVGQCAGRAVAPSRSFTAALRQPGVSLIAEFKRRSPSGGELRPGASVAEMARTYLDNGAAALSILTDAAYFGGTDEDLLDARAASSLPVLRKDFVVDPYQVYEACALGADAVLLIVRALTDTELRDLLERTDSLNMEALVETHSADEVRRALDAGARVIGVNNRDLDSLQTDVSLAPRLRPLVPAECVFVAESGVSTPEQIARLVEVRADAALVGETLLRAADPGEQLRRLVVAGAPRGIQA